LTAGDAVPKTLRGRLLLTHLAPVIAGLVALLAIELLDGARDTGWLLLFGVAMIALAAYLAILAGRRIEERLLLLSDAVQRLGSGRFDARMAGTVTATFPAELADLADAFNSMGGNVERAVDEAQAEQARLEAVLERSADGVIAVDSDGDVRYLNPAASRLLEIADRDRSMGRSLMAVVRDHEVAAVLQRCRAVDGQVAEVVQLGTLRKPVEVIFLPLQGAGAWRFLGLLHDLTEVRRIEGQRRDFVSNVSHELRTPLASIKAVVEVLADGALDDEAQTRDFLKAVDHEVDRLSQLVEEMLELSRIESGVVPFHFERVYAEELCQEAVRRLAVQAEREGITLGWRVDEEMRPLQADRERLLRALINLVHNAIKYTPSGGTVDVYARDRAGTAVLGVRDSGAGIPRDEVDRIFERFYKVDRARSSKGTGLGLAIVKHTAQAHHGAVEVESTPGHGSDFRMLLPYA
jgi:two-component system, OmpR family, phosphate regulon sensor histidine kinase PhoR